MFCHTPRKDDLGTEGEGHEGEGDIWLEGTSGSLVLMRVDSLGVVGRFRMQAVRFWSM